MQEEEWAFEATQASRGVGFEVGERRSKAGESRQRADCRVGESLLHSRLGGGKGSDSLEVDIVKGCGQVGALRADKAFDANRILEERRRRDAEIVIAQHPYRTTPRPLDREVYPWRHRMENYTGRSFAAMMDMGAAVLQLQ